MEEYTVRVYEDRTEWWQNGKVHRTSGPAVEWADGSKQWQQNGLFHRTDGPACEWIDGTKEWWQNGQRHRTDGPAVDCANGDKEYWIEGEPYAREIFLKKTQPKIEELTVAEISKRLGYEIKIVKE
jgi:hypothetical protein